ncbi:hypothetical protein NQ317_010737 [Molorchus minor]|uniref:Uncharacterized protein n=1 Tax=Molorchus minor TaxID=1323400 RepID=A0ABQ9JF92_9CUCU|nr:hypothetical protein NQ317_010737 [Molorchus minor]
MAHILLVVLIMSCDAAEKSGRELIKTCYLLYERVTDDGLVNEKLLEVADYAKEWRPIFSAAGFYDVNQSTLTSSLQALITYVVILIQFSLSLKS